VKVVVKELDDVLFRDVGDRIKNSGRCVSATRVILVSLLSVLYK